MLSDYGKTLEQLLTDTAIRLNDPFFERWSQARVTESINDTVLDFALCTEAIIQSFPLQLSANINIYDLFLAVQNWSGMTNSFAYPIRFEYIQVWDGTVLSNQYPTTNYTLGPFSFSVGDMRGYEFPEFFQGYDLFTLGEVQKYSRQLVTPNQIFFWPTPVNDGQNPAQGLLHDVIIWFVAIPNQCTAAGMDPLINPIWAPGIPAGAAARLLYEGNAEELQLAGQMDAEYEAWKGESTKQHYTGLGEYDSVRPM